MSRATSVKRRRTLRTRGVRKIAGARQLAFDRLERRLVLDSSVSWNGSALSVFDTALDGAGDDVVVTARAANGTFYVNVDDNGVTIFNGSTSNPVVPALAVQSISVTGSAFADILDLTGINAANDYNSTFLLGHIVVKGFSGNDTIALGDFGEYAEGGFGNDSIIGGSGNDTIYGGNADGNEGGYDYISGMGGDDKLYAESTAAQQNFIAPGVPKASSTVLGGSGNDFITDLDAFDYLDGGAGDDGIVAGSGPNRQYGVSVTGGAGDDSIAGTNFFDYIDGGGDDDYIDANPNNLESDSDPAQVSGGAGNNYPHPNTYSSTYWNDYGVPTGSHPQVNGLDVSAATVPDGGQLTLTAKGVGIVKPFDGQHKKITVTQVYFYIDTNNNGVLDEEEGGDKLIDTVQGDDLNGDVSLTINPVNLAAWGLAPGTYDFFAIAKSSAGFEGNYWFNSVDIVRDKVKVNGTSDATEEPATDGLVTIEREGPNDFDLTVYFSASDSDGDSDFTVSPASYSVVIPAGQSQAVVHITPIDDQIVESPAETVELDLESGDYYDVNTPSSGVVTIQEDTEPTFTVSAPSSVAEGGNPTYTIMRSGETSGSVTVYFSWRGSAIPGTDYTDPGDSVVFADGQTTQTVTPTLLDDEESGEPGEDLSLVLEGDEHYVIGSPGYADVAIDEDAEATFTVSASPASVAEGGGVTYTITRSGEMSGGVTVYFSWSGSAVPGIDYTDPGDSVVFADGQTTQTVTPTLLDDDGDGEPDEDLSLVLEGDDHYDIGSPGYADVAIVEDDDSGGDSLMLNLPPRETGAPPAAITPAQARPFLQAAAREWEAAGVDPAFLQSRLAGAAIHVTDLPDSLLGETIGDAIYLDENAAGYGWCLDDKLKGGGFAAADGATERIALPGSPAYGRVDLLTAATHELGHLLGLSDLSPDDAPHDIMDLTIGLSTRRFPATGEGPQSASHAEHQPNGAEADLAFGDFSRDGSSIAAERQAAAESQFGAATAKIWQDFGALDGVPAMQLGAVRGDLRSALMRIASAGQR